jgi:hypothetical protein
MAAILANSWKTGVIFVGVVVAVVICMVCLMKCVILLSVLQNQTTV